MTQETEPEVAVATSEPTSVEDPLPRVDVVVATRNRPDLLRLALDAIWDQSYAGEIVCHVVFDQCDPDESVARTSPTRTIQVTTNVRSPGSGRRPQHRHPRRLGAAGGLLRRRRRVAADQGREAGRGAPR